MTFETFGLAPGLLRALSAAGYTVPTPIQARAIPAALGGRDILGAAQTGTGKTAAYAVPLLQKLAGGAPANGRHGPRALVLVPTRELAVQVADSLKAYGRHLRLDVATAFGGVGMRPQIAALRRGTDILVACPGRLLDLLGSGHARLDAVEVLVLDEADRMLDMGFLPSIRRVLAHVPQRRQALLFSATFEPRVRALALDLLRDPVEVEVAARNTVAGTIVHRVHPVEASRKRELLVEILARRHADRVLVFGRTRHGCDRLAGQLEKAGLPAVAIHGDRSQAQRQQALDRFKSGRVRILVATDVAARGLDIPALPLVINHDLPMVAEDYVHRIGRTGRNGARGEALSLVAPEEAGLLRQIRRLLGAGIEVEEVPGYAPSRPLALGEAGRPARGGAGPQNPSRKPQRQHGRPQGRAAHARAGARTGRGGRQAPRGFA